MSIDFKELRKPKKSHGGKCSYKDGGHVHEDEKEDKKLIKKMVGKAKIKMKAGGDVEGKKAHARADKKPRYAAGGATKHKGKGEKGTKVNVIVAGGGGQPQMPPHPPMAPPPGAGMPPPGGMPPRPPMGAPGGMPPGGPMKRGGAAYKNGGKVGAAEREHDRKHHDEPKKAMKGDKRIGKLEKEHDRKRHPGAK